MAEDLPTSGLSKTQIVAMANAYSGNDSEVANTLLPHFQEANANDFLLTLKEVNEATRSTYSHASDMELGLDLELYKKMLSCSRL